MKAIVEVHPLPAYRLLVRFNDGLEGEVDLSDLAGKGVFAVWNDEAFFGSVRLSEHGAVAWDGEIDLCPDALYLRVTGAKPEETFPSLAPLGPRHA